MMMLKQFFVEHKTWLHTASAVLVPVKLVAQLSVARLKKAVTIQIPDGYQDERGFHFGVKPVAGRNH
jgi:hypothetical protein